MITNKKKELKWFIVFCISNYGTIENKNKKTLVYYVENWSVLPTTMELGLTVKKYIHVYTWNYTGKLNFNLLKYLCNTLKLLKYN